MLRTVFRAPPLLTACAVPLLAACASLSTLTGPEPAELHHGYPVGERILHPSQEEVAIAVRATADLEFFAPPRRLQGGAGWVGIDDVTPIAIQGAVSSDPGIVEVVGYGASRVKLRGLERGWATLELSTDQGPAELAIHVVEPAQVALQHDAIDLHEDEPRVFLSGGTARFHMVQRDSSGRVMGGWGTLVPVRADPPGSASMTLREGDIEHVDVELRQPGQITLRPLGGDPITAEVVELDEHASFGVDAIVDAPRTEPLSTMSPGAPQLVVLWVEDAAGRRVFGLIGRARLVSLTPDLCEVERMERFYSEGVYQVLAHGLGECGLEAYLDERATTLTLPIE